MACTAPCNILSACLAHARGLDCQEKLQPCHASAHMWTESPYYALILFKLRLILVCLQDIKHSKHSLVQLVQLVHMSR